MKSRKEPDYPNWICHVCGEAYGAWYKRGTYIGPPYHSATYHNGTCDVCGDTDVAVTEPRDYGHLRAKWKAEIMKLQDNNVPVTEERDYGYLELDGRKSLRTD